MKVILPLFVIIVLCADVKAQDSNGRTLYNEAYTELKRMLTGETELSFKKAVFVTENTYLDNKLGYDFFCNQISYLKRLSEQFIKANGESFIYDYEDRETILKYAAIYKVITDSISIMIDSNNTTYHVPFMYDFEDIWGKNDWRKMFVTKLLYTHTGNCHSLPYLYKILALELGVKAYLSLAPNHIYIKHRSLKTGMYNTELTSATFPIDAWLMASGYIHLDAIRSGIYMDTLSMKQSIALCVIDLANGYKKKFNSNDTEFILNCCNLALEYYPNYVNALLLKAETMKSQFDALMKKYNAEHPSEIFSIGSAKVLFDNYEKLITQIHELGYRRMPEKMYLKWLLLLKEEQEKYIDKKVNY